MTVAYLLFKGFLAISLLPSRIKFFFAKLNTFSELLFFIIETPEQPMYLLGMYLSTVVVFSGKKSILLQISLFFVQEHRKVLSRVKWYQNTTIHSTVHSFTTTCKKQDKGSTELKRKQRNSLLWNMPPLINQCQFRACSQGLQTYKSMTVLCHLCTTLCFTIYKLHTAILAALFALLSQAEYTFPAIALNRWICQGCHLP